MLKQLDEIFRFRIFENKPSEIALFVIILLAGFLAREVLAPLISRVLFIIFKSRNKINLPVSNFVEKMKKPIKRFLILIFLYEALLQLYFPLSWNLAPRNELGLKMFLLRSYEFVLILAATSILMRLVNIVGDMFLKRAHVRASRLDGQFVYFSKELIKVFLGVVAFFVILRIVFALDVTTVIAGLGIGGLAVALAGKETLENLFASFMIFLDKPFVVGDWIKVDNIIGGIEKVGFRTTKLRSVDQALLTIPNASINFKFLKIRYLLLMI